MAPPPPRLGQSSGGEAGGGTRLPPRSPAPNPAPRRAARVPPGRGGGEAGTAAAAAGDRKAGSPPPLSVSPSFPCGPSGREPGKSRRARRGGGRASAGGGGLGETSALVGSSFSGFLGQVPRLAGVVPGSVGRRSPRFPTRRRRVLGAGLREGVSEALGVPRERRHPPFAAGLGASVASHRGGAERYKALTKCIILLFFCCGV